MLDWSQCPAVERPPGSELYLFKGTQVPVAYLFEMIQSGGRIDDFLQSFPNVAREHVKVVLDCVQRSLV